jgi:hypothetical protein
MRAVVAVLVLMQGLTWVYFNAKYTEVTGRIVALVVRVRELEVKLNLTETRVRTLESYAITPKRNPTVSNEPPSPRGESWYRP